MKTAIEVLERSLKSHTNTRNSWASITDEDLSEDIADFDEKIAEIKVAIDYLQRKVKKDPRVDGLPEGNKCLFVWMKDFEKPFVGTFCHGDNIYFKGKDGYWLLSDYGSETMRHAATDEILFYADPNEIL